MAAHSFAKLTLAASEIVTFFPTEGLPTGGLPGVPQFYYKHASSNLGGGGAPEPHGGGGVDY